MATMCMTKQAAGGSSVLEHGMCSGGAAPCSGRKTLADHPAMLADLFRDAGGSAPVLTCVKTAVRVVGVSQAG